MTIAWVLTAMTTLLCELGALGAWLYSFTATSTVAGLLAGLLFFAAVIIGCIGLAILPLVLKFRKERPPRSITMVFVAIEIVPLLVAVYASLT